MGVTQQLRLQVRSVYHRAEYLARTEGTAAMLRRMAESAGLVTARRPTLQPPQPVAAPLGERAAAVWPDSVLVVSSGRPRVADVAATGLPALFRSPDAADAAAAQQLVSIVYVLGPANWRSSIAAEARRLRQPLVLDIGADDPLDPMVLAQCDAVVLAAERDLSAAATAVVVPAGGEGLGRFLGTLRGRP